MTDHSPDHAERAAIAEIIDPVAFRSHRGLYEYCIHCGDTEAEAQKVADDTHRPDCDKALAKADAVIAALRGRDAVVEWEVWQDDMPVASSTSEADARHYLMVYGQDGPATLMRVERAEIARAGSSAPATAPNSPGDRP